MDKVIVNAQSFTHIADAIREMTKNGDMMRPSEMPEKIRNIMPRDVEFGEFTPESDVTTFKVEHHLGDIPYMVVIWKDDETPMKDSVRIVLSSNGPAEYFDEAGRRVPSYGVARAVKDNGEYYVSTVVNQNGGDDGYGDTETHFFAPSSSTMKYFGGEKYRWMAVGF